MPRTDTVPRARGRLEELVREVCDMIENGDIVEPDGKPWTPHRIAKIVADRFPGSGAPPSTGAISDTLGRWSDIGFAEIGESPVAFVRFTEAARSDGLTALKAQHRANAARAKAAAAEQNPQVEAPEVEVVEVEPPFVVEVVSEPGHGHAEDW